MSFTVKTEGFNGELSLLGENAFEDIAKKALNDIRADVESITKSAVRASVKHSGESELVNSVRTYNPTMTRDNYGAKLHCGFSGRSSSGNRYNNNGRDHAVYNNDKAFWLEYGTVKQAARPWRDRASNNIDARVTPKMEQTLFKELGVE